jgi:hypothetical protein
MHLLLPSLLILGLLALDERSEPPPDEVVRVMVEAEHAHRLQSQEPARRAGSWVRVTLPVKGSAAETLAQARSKIPGTVLLERSYRLAAPGDEPLFADQWALENVGQGGGIADADIDSTEAWGLSTGHGVVVAVIDSGIAGSNPELASRIWVNVAEQPNGQDDDDNGFVDDLAGWDFVTWDNQPGPSGTGDDEAHGTRVAGLIAADVDGGGITGVAPDATVMNLRACEGGICWTLDVAAAMYYAVDNGADIINLSFGSEIPEGEGDPALIEAFEYARQSAVLVVTAAGNTPPSEMSPGYAIYPAELPIANNLSVAATTRTDGIASFSNFGKAIDIAAPGVELLSVDPDGYVYVSGTSFAAAITSGAAAVLLAVDPTMDHLILMDRLEAFADRPPGVEGKVESGRLNLGRSATHRFVDAWGHLFETEIEWAALESITKGCNPPANTLYCPSEPVSREVMAAFLTRALSLPPTAIDFFDDDGDSIFESEINRLAAAGITKGCGARRYCPENVVDRGQMAAFLGRALGLTAGAGDDLFEDDDGSLFEIDIDRLATAGITKGCNPPSNTMYCPELPVDRGAMAAFLFRALGP